MGKGVWIGFWSAAAFFCECMSEGFDVIGRLCSAMAGKKYKDHTND